MDVKAPVKKNFNRFSTFVKSGGEDYIIGNLRVAVLDVDKFYIVVCIIQQSVYISFSLVKIYNFFC